MTIHYHCQFVVFRRMFHWQSPPRSSFDFSVKEVCCWRWYTDSLTAAKAYKLLIIVANQIRRSRCIIIFALYHFFNPVAKTWKSCKKLISIHHYLETNGLHAKVPKNNSYTRKLAVLVGSTDSPWIKFFRPDVVSFHDLQLQNAISKRS